MKARRALGVLSLLCLILGAHPLECFGFPRPQVRSADYSPGQLELFLAAQAHAIVLEHPLGSITARDTVTLVALIAWDSDTPERKFEGVRIRLQKNGDSPQETIYLDASGLECAERLQSLAARRDQIVDHFRSGPANQKEWSVLNFVNNRRDPDRRDHANVTVLNVGWYRMAEEFGVVVRSVPSKREYLFPGADLGSLARMLAAGQSYLQAADDNRAQKQDVQPDR